MSIGSSAQAESEVILTVAKMIIALPLSVSAKNIFFDRPGEEVRVQGAK